MTRRKNNDIHGARFGACPPGFSLSRPRNLESLVILQSDPGSYYTRRSSRPTGPQHMEYVVGEGRRARYTSRTPSFSLEGLFVLDAI